MLIGATCGVQRTTTFALPNLTRPKAMTGSSGSALNWIIAAQSIDQQSG